MSNQKNGIWNGHALLGLRAFEALPQWEKEMIKPDLSPRGLDKPFLPKGIATSGEKLGYLCAILDLVYHDECRPYATLPDGRWIPHSPPDANWQSCAGSGLPASPSASVAITELLMKRMMDAIHANNWEEAIRHGGALAHYLQEPFTPGHAMNNQLFHELFPDPDPERHIRLHHAFDAASDQFESRRPRLMGTTVPEAAFRLQIEMERGIWEGKKLVGPIIQSVYEGKPDDARKKLLADQAGWAAFATASAWHTAISIAMNRFDPAEVAALATLDLTTMPPYFWHACQYVHPTPGCLVRKTKKIPIHVWIRGPDGAQQEELVRSGFGMGGHMGAKFFVNGDVYPRFRCRVGLPSRHTEGQDAHTRCKFYVELDEKENWIYSEDIEYQARRVFECELQPGGTVQTVDVSLGGARTLILTAQCRPCADPATGAKTWSVPHVAVCEPVLCRR